MCGIIGSGHYGKVHLAAHKQTREKFAIKALSKNLLNEDPSSLVNACTNCIERIDQ